MDYQKLYEKYKKKYINLKKCFENDEENIDIPIVNNKIPIVNNKIPILKINNLIGPKGKDELWGKLKKETEDKNGWFLDNGKIVKLENYDKTWVLKPDSIEQIIKSKQLMPGTNICDILGITIWGKISKRSDDDSGWKLNNGRLIKDQTYNSTWNVANVDKDDNLIQSDYGYAYFVIKPNDNEESLLLLWNNMNEPRKISTDGVSDNGLYAIYDSKDGTEMTTIDTEAFSKYFSITNVNQNQVKNNKIKINYS